MKTTSIYIAATSFAIVKPVMSILATVRLGRNTIDFTYVTLAMGT